MVDNRNIYSVNLQWLKENGQSFGSYPLLLISPSMKRPVAGQLVCSHRATTRTLTSFAPKFFSFAASDCEWAPVTHVSSRIRVWPRFVGVTTKSY